MRQKWVGGVLAFFVFNLAMINLPVATAAAEYDYQWVSQSAYPTINLGETKELSLKIKNTGSQTWKRDGNNAAHLGTSRPKDRNSGFSASNWIAANRSAKLIEESVAPGAEGNFVFSIAPDDSMVVAGGCYDEYFTPVIENITWMKDEGIFWKICVTNSATTSDNAYTNFKDKADFDKYFEQAEKIYGDETPLYKGVYDYMGDAAPGQPIVGNGESDSRYSSTNVQYSGIDEPDIVKVNEKNIFYSHWPYVVYDEKPISSETDFVPPMQTGETKIINAQPVNDLKISGKIGQQGDMLLDGNNLIVLAYDAVYGYDVSDATNPIEKWSYHFKENTGYSQARLYNHQLYLLTTTWTYYDRLCPMPIAEGVEVRCADIYHPTSIIDSDQFYNFQQINPENGNIEKTVSFVGASYNSAFMMSENNAYLANTIEPDYSILLVDFLDQNPTVMPEDLKNRIRTINGYEISRYSKQTEISNAIMDYQYSLDETTRANWENNINQALKSYVQANATKISRTQIVKIGLNSFGLDAVGQVPGSLLSQFSLDESNDYLRVASTVDVNWWFMWSSNVSNDTFSQVTVLDNSMQTIGQISDLGQGERIYSVRFVGDNAYVVTFKEIDPFYIIDLTNPTQPVKAGELKIPGYSSYLHPISENLILGLGMEDSKLKLALYDVSNANNPIEKSKYYLENTWSEALYDHHAFLNDLKHQIFFLPGSNEGLIISYANGQLELKKKVSDFYASRAVYINDYLYLLGQNEIKVLNENNWLQVNELDIAAFG
ncbi:MAG: beta-propeller domain-containing protein [Patescibacteria group bacterium]